MKTGNLLLLAVLFLLILSGCGADPTTDPNDVETWEFLPFYGEIRFQVVDEVSGEPIPGASLKVTQLPIMELLGGRSIESDQDGRIVVHQLQRGYGYWGEAPPPPTFTFSAPQYGSRTYSVDDLVSGTSYDPYRRDDLPTTTVEIEEGDETNEYNLPVWEFTIRLVPGEHSIYFRDPAGNSLELATPELWGLE